MNSCMKEWKVKGKKGSNCTLRPIHPDQGNYKFIPLQGRRINLVSLAAHQISGLLLRMIGASDKGAGFHVVKSTGQPFVT